LNYELCVIEAKKVFDELREATEKEDQSIAGVTDKAYCAVLGLAHVLTPENSPSSCGNNNDDWKTEHWNSALAEYMFKLIAKERECHVGHVHHSDPTRAAISVKVCVDGAKRIYGSVVPT
jgi:hypothetical protein